MKAGGGRQPPPAFVRVDVGTTDGTRVKFDKLELQVKSSDAYRKPMLSLEGPRGCVGFRPSFTFKNNGWGDVKDASISVRFTGQPWDESGNQIENPPASRSFTKSIGGFSNGMDVNAEDLPQQAGVDTARLGSERFSCESRDAIQGNLVGYHEDKPAFTMWRSTCSVMAESASQADFTHDCDFTGGANGAPIYYYDQQTMDRIVIGVNMGPTGNDANWALKLYGPVYEWINTINK